MSDASPTSPAAHPPGPARRVLFLNDLGFRYGAGIAQARQLQSMLDLGWEAAAIAWEPGEVDLPHVVTRAFNPSQWRGLHPVRWLDATRGMPDDEVIAGLMLEVSRFQPDVVVVGNIHSAQWPVALLPALRTLGCRVVAYLHDEYYFTGRCAYHGRCQRFLTGCDEQCPTPAEYPPLEPSLIAGQWRLRREVFRVPAGVELAANSLWMRDQCRAALPESTPCETLHLGADERIFTPGDKAAARRHLGLPLDRPIVLCTAVNFEDARKGTHHLKAIVAELQHEATFVAFGHNAPEIPGLIGLGYSTNAGELACRYQAADLYLGTAVEEAFGQTVMEAHLCGRPAVVFQAGGITEIVRNEITGRTVPVGDVNAAIQAIRALLADPHFLHHSAAWCRETAVRRFSLAAQGERWARYLDGHRAAGTGANPPTISYPSAPGDVHLPHRPSWPGGTPFVNAEHARIFAETSQLPGWQMQGDTEKLYEMGFHAGDVILEIGTYGGRSATVELRGALANPARTQAPQFYGVDIDPTSIARTRQTLFDQGLAEYCHLHLGTIAEFVRRWEITPTMVFLDGDHRYDGVALDLEILTQYLRPGTPILMHDFLNPENDSGEYGVRRAGREYEAAGKLEFAGCFGCTALFLVRRPGA